jgi:hypothetical protein
MPDSKNFFEFVNNENPYAYLRKYDDNDFKKDHVKTKLDAIQKIQPKFIPCIMDQSVLTNERSTTVNFVIRNGINENIMKGLAILARNNIENDINQYKSASSSAEAYTKANELRDVGFDVSFVKKHRFNMQALNFIINKFKENINLDGMEDIILDLSRLKLINKQKILRDKVFKAIRDKLDDEAILKIDLNCEIIEDPLLEAEMLVKLEKKLAEK